MMVSGCDRDMVVGFLGVAVGLPAEWAREMALAALQRSGEGALAGGTADAKALRQVEEPRPSLLRAGSKGQTQEGLHSLHQHTRSCSGPGFSRQPAPPGWAKGVGKLRGRRWGASEALSPEQSRGAALGLPAQAPAGRSALC